MKNTLTSSITVALLLIIFNSTSPIGQAQERPAGPRVIEITADKDNTFKVPGTAKPVITLKPGETVVLRVTAHFGGGKSREDYVHSLVIDKLRDQGWDIRLKEGTEDFTVVAPKSTGEYQAECTVWCGRGHDDMKMKVIVKN